MAAPNFRLVNHVFEPNRFRNFEPFQLVSNVDFTNLTERQQEAFGDQIELLLVSLLLSAGFDRRLGHASIYEVPIVWEQNPDHLDEWAAEARIIYNVGW